jgi:hypothetical protein
MRHSKNALEVEMAKKATIRFRDFPEDDSRESFKRIMNLSLNREIVEETDVKRLVDIEITGPYSGDSDSFQTPPLTRLKRGVLSKISTGAHLSIPSLATEITPNSKAKFNIWYTGENQRPPYGNWDAYLSFDLKFPKENNFYLPLWFLTSTDYVMQLKKSYWGSPFPSLEKLSTQRTPLKPKKKFACAFFGKNYRLRLHALDKLRKIGKVDVFGAGARNPIDNPYEKAREYKFVLCFENDLYPGYVTEKPVEAYLSGTIPLYYGLDSAKLLNAKAMLNLNDFQSQDQWLERISELNGNTELYNEVYAQPLLLKKPKITDLINFLRKSLGHD